MPVKDTVARATASFATEHDNNTLYKEMTYSRSDLEYMPDNDLSNALHMIIDKAGKELNSLKDYGIDQTKYDAATAALKVADEMQTSPRTTITEGATATMSISQGEAAGRKALKIIDGMVGQFVANYSAFVTQYKQGRIIVDAGRRHKQKQAAEQKEGDGNKPA